MKVHYTTVLEAFDYYAKGIEAWRDCCSVEENNLVIQLFWKDFNLERENYSRTTSPYYNAFHPIDKKRNYVDLLEKFPYDNEIVYGLWESFDNQVTFSMLNAEYTTYRILCKDSRYVGVKGDCKYITCEHLNHYYPTEQDIVDIIEDWSKFTRIAVQNWFCNSVYGFYKYVRSLNKEERGYLDTTLKDIRGVKIWGDSESDGS